MPQTSARSSASESCDEPVPEVGEHDVGAPARQVVVERDRAPDARARRVLEPDRRRRPAPGQRRHVPRAGLVAGLRAAAGARARSAVVHDALDPLGRQVQLLAALVEVVAQAREPLAHAPLLRQQRRAARGCRRSGSRRAPARRPSIASST